MNLTLVQRVVLSLGVGFTGLWATGEVYDPPPCPSPPTRSVDLVICLDTSGSMTALIDSARAKLWDIVNEIARSEPTPRLRVGLLTYGSPNLSTPAAGWVVRHTDLTTDLDSVYARMMAMSTNGGDEYVGWVLNDAVKTMSWSRDPNAVRMIFVAGNESADQAAERFNFRHIAELARAKDIVINAIYAGDRNQGVNEHWDQVALHGGGCFSAIDMKRGTVQIAAPQDKILIKLNAELNATYLPYGERGRVGAANQLEQDKNAVNMGRQSGASRAVAKATRVYRNESWDLVDAAAEPGFELEEVKKEALPPAMQPLAPKERKVYVEQMRTRRAEIQKRIQKVSVERERFLEEARRQQGGDQVGLDDAVRRAVRKQLDAKGFKTAD